jgi:copper(I)-binding protein
MKLFITLAFLSFSFMPPALAFDPETTEVTQSIIEVQNPYAFATLPGATTGAAFMIIKNTGDMDDKLVGAQSKIAEITEIHQNIIDPDDGKMMMRKVKDITLPMGEQVTLEPKGYHVMFIKMKDALAMDNNIEITLLFEKAGEVKVSVPIVAPGIRPKQKKIMPWDTNEEAPTNLIEEAPQHIEKTGDLTPKVLEERTDY